MGAVGRCGRGRGRAPWTWALVWQRSPTPWRWRDRTSSRVLKGHRAPVSTAPDGWHPGGYTAGWTGEAGHSTTSLWNGGGEPSHMRRALGRIRRRPARRGRGAPRSVCATTSGGSLRQWTTEHQRRYMVVRPSSRLSAFSLFFVLTMGYASKCSYSCPDLLLLPARDIA